MALLIIAPLALPAIVVLVVLLKLERLFLWDSGPLLLKEPRLTRGREFKLYKLNMYREAARSRYVETSEKYRTQRSYADLQLDRTSLTPIGVHMKRYYMDELGQILNVIKGDMTLVGPRPLPKGFPNYDSPPRQRLRAGVSGIASAQWKTEAIDDEGQVAVDSRYLEIYEHGSLLDLLKTDLLALRLSLKAVIMGLGR